MVAAPFAQRGAELMQLVHLDLLAFGPFTGHRFDFGAQPAGLHIIYGANEAGKSSSLRGLKALLFGFDERTPDNHLHDSDKLRVAGCVRNARGEQLDIIRRKGRKGTLATPDGQLLDDAVLLPYLNGMTADMFDSLFGIDHRALVQGGQDILEQKGDVGQALFSASLGSHTVHKVLNQLDSDALALFKPRGSTQQINALIKAYGDIQRQLRDQRLTVSQWEDQRRRLDSIVKTVQALDAQLAEKSHELQRLERLQRVIPRLARYDQLQASMAALGDVVVLGADFSQRRQTVQRELAAAHTSVALHEPQYAEVQRQLAALGTDSELLAQEADLEDLHARLTEYRRGCDSQPRWQAELQQLQRQIAQLTAQFNQPADAPLHDWVQRIQTQRHRLQQAGEQYVSLRHAEQTARHQLDQLADKCQRGEQALAQCPLPPPLHGLSAALHEARQAGALEAQHARLQLDADKLNATLERELAQLGCGGADPAQVARWPVPQRDQLRSYADAWQSLRQQQDTLAQRRADLQQQVQHNQQLLAEVDASGELPSEADLLAKRAERDGLWQAIRSGQTDAAQFERYAVCVIQADDLADRLRHDADRVQVKARAVAALQALADQQHSVQAQQQVADQDQQALAQRWQHLWQGCARQPEAPQAMLDWQAAWQHLVERVARREDLQLEQRRLQQDAERLSTLLQRELAALSAPVLDCDRLPMLVDHAARCLEQFQHQQQEHAAARQQLAQWRSEAVTAEQHWQAVRQALTDWQATWQQLLGELALPADLPVNQLSSLLDQISQLQRWLSETDALQQSIANAQALQQQFESRLIALAQRWLAPDWHRRGAEAQIGQLMRQLNQQREDALRRHDLLQRAQTLHDALTAARATVQAMQNSLAALCREAGVANADQLERAEQDAQALLRDREQSQTLAAELAQDSHGASLAQLREQAAALDSDSLPGMIATLTQEISALRQQHSEQLTLHGSEQRAFQLLQGGDQAALLSDKAQVLLADIRANSEQFVRNRVASALLRQHIERFRQENQGSLVACASAHFQRLTCGRYTHLRVDFNQRDEPVLMGMRSESVGLNVQGMSAGTRDQLYLALRLAALERYLESSEPLPFIVDDILVEFDDRRSLAALQTLAELAQRTQVILFTHHSRIVEQVKELGSGAQVHSL